MLAITHELLLFASLAAPPTIFGYLLYLGLHIPKCGEQLAEHGKSNRKQPRRLQP